MAMINTDSEESFVVDLVRRDYDGLISKYTLEGILLYTLGCSHIRMYHVVMNLLLKELMVLVELDDGEYYKLV